MSKFTFQCTDDDDAVVTVEFEAEIWLDAFPKFLQLCRGSGFIVANETALYAPTASEYLFSDRDFLIFDSDFEKCDCTQEAMFDPAPCEHMDDDESPFPGGVVAPEEEVPCPGCPECTKSKTLEQWVAEGHNLQRSDCYYDFSRNK